MKRELFQITENQKFFFIKRKQFILSISYHVSMIVAYKYEPKSGKIIISKQKFAKLTSTSLVTITFCFTIYHRK